MQNRIIYQLIIITFTMIIQFGIGHTNTKEEQNNFAKTIISDFDVFPLNLGNRYQYEHLYSDTTYWVSEFESHVSDSGMIEYVIMDSVRGTNVISWSVGLRVEVLRRYITPEIDTTYWIQDSTTFELHESTIGRHKLTASGILLTEPNTNFYVWIRAWDFRSHLDTTQAFYRFSDSANPLFVLSNFDGTDSLWFENTKGLIKRNYFSWYVGIHRIYTKVNNRLLNLIVSVDNSNIVGPEHFELMQNYPNPFNPSTEIKFELPSKRHVTLKVYDISGRLVNVLVNREISAGIHSVSWDSHNAIGVRVPSGIYLCRIEAGEFSKTVKMSLLK